MNIELYIDNQLCDLPDPSQMNIVLKRVFIKPSELSTKDAQKSYDITLPPTPRNNKIFNHVNIEEVQGKFNAYPDAKLYAGGVLILDGKFRLSGIDRNGYRGNLGVPAPLTAKDVFGNTTMNQIGKWLFKFDGVADIETYNDPNYYDEKYGEISPFIIPFALYGLPRIKNYLPGVTVVREEINSGIEFKHEDFPPSVNCLHLIKKIFESADYNISGSAFDDERLKHLYVSYKNPEDFKIELNVKPLSIKGSWTNYDEKKYAMELAYHIGAAPYWSAIPYSFVVTNLFSAVNINPNEITIESDDKESVKKYTTSDGVTHIKFRIPYDGLYKINFSANLKFLGIAAPGKDGGRVGIGSCDSARTEVKIVRYKEEDDIEKKLLEREKFDNVFYRDNQDNEFNIADSKYIAKGNIFPQDGVVNFIDPKQNPNIVGGFSWGQNRTSNNSIGYFHNPVVARKYDGYSIIKHHNPIAASGKESWTAIYEEGIKEYSLSAVASPGYLEWDGEEFVSTDKFKVDLQNAPATETKQAEDAKSASGQLSQIMYFEEGEYITLMFVTDKIDSRTDVATWRSVEVDYQLTLTPFMHSPEWLKVDTAPSGSKDGVMDWNDTSTFDEGQLNLTTCLPKDTKIDEWLDNFSKTFNLEMINTGEKTFELNIKNKDITRFKGELIDLGKKTSVEQRSSETLDLPRVYKLGFEIDTSEYGYVKTQKTKGNEKITNSGYSGGGEFPTGSTDTSEIEQKSGFSYCWYRDITDRDRGETINLPIITAHEAWDYTNNYGDVKDKRYFDLRQRFWYNKKENHPANVLGKQVPLAMVQNSFDNNTLSLVLDYKDALESITRSYFLLMDNRSSYTVVDCYLTPDEYQKLSENYVCFNGDLYIVAEVDGYDPQGLRPAKLKLIRRIV